MYSSVLFQGKIKSLLMLRLTTTRIILGFICFGPICFTGRTHHQKLFSTTPCSDQNLTRLRMNLDAHQTARVYYALITLGATSHSLWCWKVPRCRSRTGRWVMLGSNFETPPLLSSLSVLSSSPPIATSSDGWKPYEDKYTRVHYRPQGKSPRGHLLDQWLWDCGGSMWSICLIWRSVCLYAMC